MIAYLDGKITFKSPTLIYMDIGGIAYEVHTSLATYSAIEHKEKVKLYTYLHVKEDSQTLYGFSEKVEKEMFILLLSVSGIGPNTARVTLSFMSVKEVQSAILSENVAAFKKVKGVGPKTAKRVILDLKDKLMKEELEVGQYDLTIDNGIKQEAISALMSLGFQKAIIEKQIDKIILAQPELNQVEILIKEVLKQMR